MPLSEEHKEKMRLGRERARVARAGRPRVPLVEQPEFKAAVAAAVEEASRQLLAEIAQLSPRAAPSPESLPVPVGFDPNKLAMAIAELTDQGSGMKRVPPEVIEARNAAARRMKDLLLRANETGVELIYILNAPCVLPIDGCGETLIDPLQRGSDNVVRPTKIRWPLAPNLAMEPANEAAAEVMAAFKESIGNKGTATGADDGQLIGGQPAPPSGGYIDNNGYAVSPMGNVVNGSAAAAIRANEQGHRAELPPRSRFGLIVDESGSILTPNGGGPPYRDVRVLGTIAPPARQNG